MNGVIISKRNIQLHVTSQITARVILLTLLHITTLLQLNILDLNMRHVVPIEYSKSTRYFDSEAMFPNAAVVFSVTVYIKHGLNFKLILQGEHDTSNK